MLIFLGLSFLHIWSWCLNLCVYLQTEAAPPANEKYVLLIFKKSRRRRHFWEFGLSLQEHCFHQFESNLKTRHYEYALHFEGYFICSFVSAFSVLFFISHLFPKRLWLFISWLLYRCLFLIFVRWCVCSFIFVLCVFKFLPYFFHDYFSKKNESQFLFRKNIVEKSKPIRILFLKNSFVK